MNYHETLLFWLAKDDIVMDTTALFQYLELLDKWNKVYNLTAIRDKTDRVIKHILDSLYIHPYVTGDKILDVGSGAGLPGIPLAILFPNKSFTLLDSNGKKTRFLNEVKRALHLSNVTIINERVEAYTDGLFDTITNRAYGSILDTIQTTKHLLSDNGQWLLMKGQKIEETLESLLYPYTIIPYTLKPISHERHVVIITNQSKD